MRQNLSDLPESQWNGQDKSKQTNKTKLLYKKYRTHDHGL